MGTEEFKATASAKTRPQGRHALDASLREETHCWCTVGRRKTERKQNHRQVEVGGGLSEVCGFGFCRAGGLPSGVSEWRGVL